MRALSFERFNMPEFVASWRYEWTTNRNESGIFGPVSSEYTQWKNMRADATKQVPALTSALATVNRLISSSSIAPTSDVAALPNSDESPMQEYPSMSAVCRFLVSFVRVPKRPCLYSRLLPSLFVISSILDDILRNCCLSTLFFLTSFSSFAIFFCCESQT